MNTININGVLYEVYHNETHVHELRDMTDDTSTEPRYTVSNDYVVGTRVNPMSKDSGNGYMSSIGHAAVIHIDVDGIIASSEGEGDVICVAYPEVDLQKILDRVDFSNVDAEKIYNIGITLNAYNGNTNTYSDNIAVVYCGENYFTDTNSAVVCNMH